MASTTVRVSAQTHEVLRKLAAATGEPLRRVPERAVENYRREQFFAEFNAAFDRLRSDPVAWGEYLAPDQPGTGGPRRRGALHQP
jgi:hypothetical protein